MRKRVFGRKFSRGRKSREALLRSLIRALIINGKITTTEAKAKAILGQVDKLINSAKKDSVFAQREVLSYLGNDRDTVNILFAKIVPSLSEGKSGFVKITLLPPRRGDNAPMARMEWVERIQEKKEVKAEKKPTMQKSNKKEAKKA